MNMFHDLVLRLADTAAIESLGGASDCGMLVYHRGVLIAWTDDYGTARHPDQELPEPLAKAIEALVDPASDVWGLLPPVDLPVPKPLQWPVVLLWVTDGPSVPSIVGGWSQADFEKDGTELEAIAKRRWYDQFGESYEGEWRFWTTVEQIPICPQPAEMPS